MDTLAQFAPFGAVFTGAIVSAAAARLCVARFVVCLKEAEQLVVEGFGGVTVLNGPGVQVVNPFHRSARVQKAISVGEREYVIVRNSADGSERTEKGPQLLFLRAYDAADSNANALVVGRTEYLLVVDNTTGKKRVLPGPTTYVRGPHDTVSSHEAPVVGRTEYLVVEDKLSGKRRLVRGPQTFFPASDEEVVRRDRAQPLEPGEYCFLKDSATGKQWQERGPKLVLLEPTWERGPVKRGITLKAWEYVRVLDSASGKVVVHVGEQMVALGPTDTLVDGKKLPGIELYVQQYVTMLDQATGEVRVVRGPGLVFPGPADKVLCGRSSAVELDHERSALVRSKDTGALRLVTGARLFFPGADEEIEEERPLTKLGAHEAMVVKDQQGQYSFYYGSEAKCKEGCPRIFFLPPHAEVATQLWSTGIRRDQRTLRIQVLDTRAQYMYFEFNCRTSDNVELVLDGTFFWQISDLPALMRTTGDVPGDVCNHARSQFIRLVSRKTLREFMENCHSIAKQVHREDQDFYVRRGIKIWSLEIIGYRCAEESTSEILQEIIQETTNRMNRLSQAESENEVKMFRMQGMIEQEKLRSELLTIQHEHQQAEAKLAGSVEASRARSFLATMSASVPDGAERARMWETLRRVDAVDHIAATNAHLYYPSKDLAVEQ